MRVDSFDNTLVCGEEDFQTVLTYFKDYRLLPDYIEKSILKIIASKFSETKDDLQTVEDYFELIPEACIAKIINDINHMFSSPRKVEYSNRYLAYLLYYLPVNVFKIWKPLVDLQLKNILKQHLRILDVGTGPGSIPIGIIEYYRGLAKSFPEILFSLTFTLIDGENEFLEIAKEMISSIDKVKVNNLEINIEKIVCQRVDVDSDFSNLGKFDLITMSNFLNIYEGENNQKAVKLIKNFKGLLKGDGSMIIIEPGDEISSKSLKRIRNQVVNNDILKVFSPCNGMWEEKNKYHCQCFSMVRCFWQLPKIYEYLSARGLNKGKRIDVPFNYLVLRNDEIKKYEVVKNCQHYVKLVDLPKKLGQTVNVMAQIRTVIKKGDNFYIALCDGSCDFSEKKGEVWISLSQEQMIDFGIDIPLIAGEKITFKKVLVKFVNREIRLEIMKNTRIIVNY